MNGWLTSLHCLFFGVLVGLAMGFASQSLAQTSSDVTPPDDAALAELVRAVHSNTATYEQRCDLLNVLLDDRQRVSNLGVDSRRLLRRLAEYADCEVADPHLSYRWSLQQCGRADSTTAERLFERALELAPSDKQRADYLYSREAKGYGGGGCDRALEIDPTFSPCLFKRLVALGREVGIQRSVEGRFAYWCLADRFRQLGASAVDSRIATAAQRAARQYERAAPTREQSRSVGYQPGQMVMLPLGATQSCRTPVR